MVMLSPEDLRLIRIFHPYALDKHLRLVSENRRFVHYTSAAAAMRILQTREVWMRNASCMNDYMEVEHGIECLASAYKGEVGKVFRQALDRMYDGLSGEVANLFDDWAPHLRRHTYLTCMSEHLDSEDRNGRLSMWRAYGNETRVALVLKNTPFVSPSDALKAYTSPVAYLDSPGFANEFQKFADNVSSEASFLQSLGRDAMKARLFDVFKTAALCTKHPGFHEEREWRVVYSPTMDRSDRLAKEVRVIDGTPQTIFKIPLKNIPEEGLVGADAAELLDRVIIGPTLHPTATRDALVDILEAAAVPDAPAKVVVSDIPLRKT